MLFICCKVHITVTEVQNMLFICLYVFARNLDKIQSRYRPSKTVDFTLLTWTLVLAGIKV